MLRATGVSVGSIARALGISGPAVTQWRTGSRLPALAHRAELESRYGIPAAAWDRAPAEGGADSPPPARNRPPPPPRRPRTTEAGIEALTGPEAAAELEAAARAAGPRMTLEQVTALVRRLEPVVMDPTLPPSTLSQLTSTLTRLLQVQSQLAGDGRTAEERLAASPAYQATMAAVLEALADHPEALAAVERALARLA